jgi:hypothetical protein
VHPEVAWREITGIRLILAHAYFHIDHDIIGNVISQHVPRLRAQLQLIAESLVDSDSRTPYEFPHVRLSVSSFGHVHQRCAAPIGGHRVGAQPNRPEASTGFPPSGHLPDRQGSEATDPTGRTPGHRRAVLMATTGQLYCPPPGSSCWPLTDTAVVEARLPSALLG